MFRLLFLDYQAIRFSYLDTYSRLHTISRIVQNSGWLTETDRKDSTGIELQTGQPALLSIYKNQMLRLIRINIYMLSINLSPQSDLS